MSTGAVDLTLRELPCTGMGPWLASLDRWLLPDAFHPVQHTWPQLYRRDGHGTSIALFEGDRLVSHAAMRPVELAGEGGLVRACLVGSVATDPERRGRGLASRALAELLVRCRGQGTDLAILWAERPELYGRHGFSAGPREAALALRSAGAGDIPPSSVRRAEIRDHEALLRLHRQKPLRAERSPQEMSLLLSTPAMHTFVLEREGRIAAYACCGKGADFEGWWHETGGDDHDLATLLPAALAAVGQDAAMVLLPPYRDRLPALLGENLLERATLDGPMALPFTDRGRARFYIDGLDSV